jgi:hypothetical protein
MIYFGDVIIKDTHLLLFSFLSLKTSLMCPEKCVINVSSVILFQFLILFYRNGYFTQNVADLLSIVFPGLVKF